MVLPALCVNIQLSSGQVLINQIIKKDNEEKFLYNALIILALTACTEQDIIEQPSTPNGGTEVRLPADVNSGELLIKFKPEMTDILDRTMTRATGSGGAMTRSGIPSTDEVLEILGGYHFERIFPIDSKNEERTRIAGLHLWYQVKFDEDTDLQEAAKRLSALGEISKVQGNQRIKRAYDVKNRRSYISQSALQQRAATRSGVPAGRFSDPGLPYQWHYINSGQNAFDKQNNAGEIIAGSSAGCDTGCYEAWQKCTGDPSVIVAVLDDGVMYTHPDLADNIWVNEGEELRAGTDADGNGYKDDKYGYNFVTNTANISWTDVEDIGHGTHVSGTIAAMNNGEGVCGIAGGDGTKNSGVKIMICQVFSGNNSVSLNGEAKAIKYAADNGAVILQCSWGYNSAEANEVEGYTPGPATEKNGPILIRWKRNSGLLHQQCRLSERSDRRRHRRVCIGQRICGSLRFSGSLLQMRHRKCGCRRLYAFFLYQLRYGSRCMCPGRRYGVL